MALIDKLPLHYRNNEGIGIQEALEEQVKAINKDILNLTNTFFLANCKDLKVWEELIDLKVDINKSDEFRRERIKAKLRGQGTTNKALIENVSSSFSGGEVEIIEDSYNNKFTIKFIGQLGIPANMEDLELSIEEIKPAHLIFDFKYSYRTHKTLNSYTHNQLESFNHNQLREGEI